jgi:hypothetical protein
MHIFRDQPKRSLWLSQQAYIEKLANEFITEPKSNKWPLTPVAEEELFPLPTEDEVLKTNRTRYQRKIGSILYVAISTRPDIAFAVARLSRYNCRPGKTHQEAADRVIQYLYRTRYRYIQFGHESTATSFVCASDASFADNTLDQKSSQGYILKGIWRTSCLESKQAGHSYDLLNRSRTTGTITNGEGVNLPVTPPEGTIYRTRRISRYRMR